MIKKTLAVFAVIAAMNFTASAAPILLGTIKDGQPASDLNEQLWVDFLLGLAPGSSTTTLDIPGDNTTNAKTFNRNTNVDPGSGNVTALGTKSANGDLTVDAGAEYVAGKYGNIGFVVWYTGGEAFTLPSKWKNATGENLTGGGLSHHTTFGRTNVPDTANSLVIMGLGLGCLGLLRRPLLAR